MEGSDGAFRYDYAFDTMKPGWVSAMAQGQALSVLARAFLLSGDTRYVVTGNAALEFLLTPAEQGGVRGNLKDLNPSLERYISLYEYDHDLSPHTLNGFIFTIFGLYDWSAMAELAPGSEAASSVARAAFDCSAHTVASAVHYYDIGGFSGYDMRQALEIGDPFANGHYQKVHVAQLVALYSITQRPELLHWAEVWAEAVGQSIP